MKQFIAELFIWWHHQTMGMRLKTWIKGHLVGEDAAGNKYYTDRKTGRRWVIYNGPAEASMIPPGWHGWMHYRTDVAPSAETYVARGWEKPHVANLSGTAGAYRPDGSMLNAKHRPEVSGDYDAWSPE